MGELNDPTGEKELIAEQLREGVSASEVMAGVRARAASRVPSGTSGSRRPQRVERRVDLAGHAIAAIVPAPPAELEVRPVPYEVVAEWKSQAARDHVALGPTGNTTWYAAFRGKVIVGVAGLIRVGKLVRVKGVYVPRALRGEGIGTFLTEAVIAAAPADCDVEVFAYNSGFYADRGFEVGGEFRPGVTRLIFARPR